MMITETPHGPVPLRRRALVQHAVRPRRHHHRAASACGSTPALARGVLALPGRHPGRPRSTPSRTPSRARSCTRRARGEMAALGEIPFGRYYGSVDSTPLFVMLAGAYYERTGDRAFIERSGRNLERALDWIDSYGDRDGDGFVEYHRQSRRRAGAPGLEGLARLGLPRRRHAGRGPDRAVRGAGLRLRRQARRGRARRARSGHDAARPSC